MSDIIPDLDERLEEQIIPRCIGCGKTPNNLPEYVEAAGEYVIWEEYHNKRCMTPNEYIRQEEGTYNKKNGHFACTKCYIEMGMPSSPTGWIAP